MFKKIAEKSKNFLRDCINFNGVLPKKAFWINILIWFFLSIMLLTLTNGSYLEFGVIGIIIITLTSFVMQRFRDINGTWYLPLMTIGIFVISFVVSIILYNTAVTSISQSTAEYTSIINSFLLNNAVYITTASAGALLIGLCTVVIIIGLIFGIWICCFKQSHSKIKKIFMWFNSVLIIVFSILLAIVTGVVVTTSNQAINDANNEAKHSIFSQQENGDYIIYGVFSAATADNDINEIKAEYEASMNDSEIVNDYESATTNFTEYSSGIYVISLFAQNCSNNGQSTGLLELGILSDKDADVSINTIIVNGTQYTININTVLTPGITFIPIELGIPFNDGDNFRLETKLNGQDTKMLVTTVSDINNL